MTKKEMFAEIRNRVADNAEMVAFIDHEIELLSKRRGSSKPTQNQKDNEVLMGKIVDVLGAIDDKMRANEIVKEFDNEYTIQKISSLLSILIDRGVVEKVMEKKVAYFRLKAE